MQTALITSIVALLGQLVPLIGTNSTLTVNIINTLIALIPAITQEVETLIPMVKNIIAALQDDSTITPDDLTALQALDAQCDAAFEAAAVDPIADAAT
jgi:hypothetical protein